jgi:hypothetical protein
MREDIDRQLDWCLKSSARKSNDTVDLPESAPSRTLPLVPTRHTEIKDSTLSLLNDIMSAE